MIPQPEDVHVEQLAKTRSELREWKDDSGQVLGWEGVVWTPHGAVAVISSQRTGKTLYRAAHAGKLYRWHVAQYNPSPYVLARDARRLIEFAVHTLR